MAETLPFRADYYPILGNILDEIGVASAINKQIAKKQTHSEIDVGTFTCLMILNLLGDVNIRLYRMHDFFEDKALPLLIPWNPDIDHNKINDDRGARVLDALWEADPQKVFSRVANEAIRVHSLEKDTIHVDTTSKSFQGAYETPENIGIVPKIAYGHNKDHRPDLKQLVFGVGTTSDGIPILAEVADGNESDMTLNGRWIKRFRSVLGNDSDDFLLYVADSALVTTNNLELLDSFKIDMISRLPGRFGIEALLKGEAYARDDWDNIGKLSEEKSAASYQCCETINEINGRSYRFIVVKSDHKDQRKVKTLERNVKKEYQKAIKNIKELRKRPFACERDAIIESKKFCKKYKMKFYMVDWKLETKKERVKRKKRGRPKKGEMPQFQSNYYLIGTPQLNEQVFEEERELCGLFVLITSLQDTRKHPAKYILERYKGQGNVERIFKFMKNPAWIGAFCLKKPERLAALGYVLIMAAMVYTLWERRVRMALANSNEAPIEGLNRRKTKKPTTYALQTVMSSILIQSQVVEGKIVSIWLPRPLKPNQRRVLQLSGFAENIYGFGKRPSMKNSEAS